MNKFRTELMSAGVMAVCLATCTLAAADEFDESTVRFDREPAGEDVSEDVGGGVTEERDANPRRLPSATHAPVRGTTFAPVLPNRVPVPPNEYERLTREIYELELRKQAIPLGWPIALLATGGAVGLLAVSLGLSTSLACSRWGDTSCGSYAVGGLVVGAVGAGVALYGGVWLGMRGSERRFLNGRIEELEMERGVIEHDELRTLRARAPREDSRALTVTGLSFDPTHRALIVSGSF